MKKIIKKSVRWKKIGDVYEIATEKGLAYFQYTHEHTRPPKWGSLIRVLSGFYQTRLPNDKLAELVNKPHRFQTFLFLTHAIKDDEVVFIENFPIPDFAKNFPIFKNTNANRNADQKDAIWSLWDGEKAWRVGKLSEEEQMKYPFHSLCDATALSIKIERGVSGQRKLC